MQNKTNHLGQPIGEPVAGWTPPPPPSRDPMVGRFCRLEALDPNRHARDLYDANALDTDGRSWTYLVIGPFVDFEGYREWVAKAAVPDDPLFYAIIAADSGKAVGVASYLRIDPANGVVEVGSLNFSPLLQQKPAATEAMYLMMERALTLGYRRYEWKCDDLNAPSRRAAERLGFTFEGIFPQAVVYKGRNRDTAWYSIIDAEWPALHSAFVQWLAPSNFDVDGKQKSSLSRLTAALRQKQPIGI